MDQPHQIRINGDAGCGFPFSEIHLETRLGAAIHRSEPWERPKWWILKLTNNGILPYNPIMKEQKAPTARLEARLPIHVHAMLKRAAELQGRTLTDFVVSASSEAARKAIESSEVILLSLEDQRLFAESLHHSPEPNTALHCAFEKHRELFGSE